MIISRLHFLTSVISLFIFSHFFSQNLVKNPGFVTASITPERGIWIAEFTAITADAGNACTGNYSAKHAGNLASLSQFVNLEPTTTYTVNANVKTEPGHTVEFGVDNIRDTLRASLVFNDAPFAKNSLSFTTDAIPGHDSQIYIWKEKANSCVWAENFVLNADTTGQIPDETGGLGTYYVSPQGNDLNAGNSLGQAWKTTEKVNHVNFEPGDSILFDGGKIFYGGIRFNQTDSGAINNKVYVGSYGTGRAIIDAGTGSGFTASDCDNIIISNLNFKGDGRKTGNKGNGISFSFCSNIQVNNAEISGFQHSGLVVNNTGINYRITNIYAHNNGFAGIFFGGTNKSSLSDIYIAHCFADNNPGDPTILNNHSGNGILVYMASNVLIEYCEASNNGWDMPRIGNGPGGIWVAEVDSTIIQHCISHNNKTPYGAKDGIGFDLDGGTTNSVIQYCLSYNNHGAGYGIFQYSGASDWKNNTIRYCISENDGFVSTTGSVVVWNGSWNKNNFQGLEFYNNVIFNSNKAAFEFLDHFNSGFNFRNNIFVSKTYNVFNRINGENFQGNCWYTLNGGSHTDSLNFINWLQNTNQEMLNGEIAGIYSNPKLINPGNSTITDPALMSSVDDYKVTDGSKVIDSGLDLKLHFNIDPGAHDYFGNLFIPEQLFDMGIYKYLFKQRVDLAGGWNILSLNVMPGDSDLMSILQPLIDDGKLKKVMDESGKVIEDWGTFGGWQNTIGDLKTTEGYKINLSSAATLNVSGKQSLLPFEIPLKSGWNIISWPSPNEQNGKDVFQTLINEGKLKKVMDETGKVIEDWGSFGGWQNTIGNLKPGEGYKVNVNVACTLTIIVTGTKSEEIIPELMASTHFIPAYKGNGTDHANINLLNLAESGILEGDEIGIFDGDICVGSAQINIQHSTFNIQPTIAIGASISIPTSAADGIEGKNGYSGGNPIILKLFRNGVEYPLTIQPFGQSKAVFEKGESLFAMVDLETGLEGLPELQTTEINCYPNPFSDEVTIEIRLLRDSEVEVEVLNQLGQKIKYLAAVEQLNRGVHRLIWEGTNAGESHVTPGIYLIRLKINDAIYYRKVIYSK